ncbi:hypothetical protein [Actinomadura craniellae]|uniref:hypothetical protein n=1 Tax=Actinomadura craniellae TaxID=2231787 RepID=UPI0011BFCE1E|nr:hypothetical protein [Actinomadura craniellae]
MGDVVIRPVSRQAALWPVSTGLLVVYAVVGYLVVARYHLGLGLLVAAVELALAGGSLWAFAVDRRRGIVMDGAGVTVTGWAGARTLAYEEISHTEVFRRLGSSRLALHLTDGRRVVLGAPRDGGLEPDARFAEKVAAVEGEIGRRTRPVSDAPQ